MPVYLRPCRDCRRKANKPNAKTRKKNRRGSASCGCRWQAVAPPSIGRKSLGLFTDKGEAERSVAKVVEDAKRGIDLVSQTTTLGEAAQRFLVATKPELAKATFSRYEELWRSHCATALGAIPVAKIKPAHILNLYGKLQTEPIIRRWTRKDGTEKTRECASLKPNTVRHLNRFLSRLFSWAETTGLASRNVMRSVRPPRPTPSPARALSLDESLAFLDAAAASDLQPFFVVAMHTGARRGELGALQWDAVDFERRVLTVRQAVGQDRRGATFIKPPKSGKSREVPLDAQALAALRAVKARTAQEKLAAEPGEYADGDFVFCYDRGAMLDLDEVSKAFSAIAKAAGVKGQGVTLHSLRHSFATLALINGADVNSVAAVMGHADVSTTLRLYGHCLPGSKERAVAALGDAFDQAQARRVAGKNGRP